MDLYAKDSTQKSSTIIIGIYAKDNMKKIFCNNYRCLCQE
jgi:hypothetical protein